MLDRSKLLPFILMRNPYIETVVVDEATCRVHLIVYTGSYTHVHVLTTYKYSLVLVLGEMHGIVGRA